MNAITYTFIVAFETQYLRAFFYGFNRRLLAHQK